MLWIDLWSMRRLPEAECNIWIEWHKIYFLHSYDLCCSCIIPIGYETDSNIKSPDPANLFSLHFFNFPYPTDFGHIIVILVATLSTPCTWDLCSPLRWQVRIYLINVVVMFTICMVEMKQRKKVKIFTGQIVSKT